jgi:hypothetical protein
MPEGKRQAATRERFAAVHALSDKGVGIGRIAELLDMDRKTVRKYAHAAHVEDLLVPPGRSRRLLAPWIGYLNQRWNEGCTDSGRLHREIQALGYRGSSRSVRRWLEPLRTSPTPAPTLVTAPTVRQATAWITRHPDTLTSDEALQLKRLLARCPELAAAADQVRDFAKMMKNLTGQHLPEWIEKTEALPLKQLSSFASHLRQDLAAVTAGLTLPWSSGRVEGHVNRIKFLSGRATDERSSISSEAAFSIPPDAASRLPEIWIRSDQLSASGELLLSLDSCTEPCPLRARQEGQQRPRALSRTGSSSIAADTRSSGRSTGSTATAAAGCGCQLRPHSSQDAHTMGSSASFARSTVPGRSTASSSVRPNSRH